MKNLEIEAVAKDTIVAVQYGLTFELKGSNESVLVFEFPIEVGSVVKQVDIKFRNQNMSTSVVAG